MDPIADEEIGTVILDGIAGVYQQGRIGAVLCNCRGELGHAAGGARLIQGIVPGHKLAVQVTGGKNAQGFDFLFAGRLRQLGKTSRNRTAEREGKQQQDGQQGHRTPFHGEQPHF